MELKAKLKIFKSFLGHIDDSIDYDLRERGELPYDPYGLYHVILPDWGDFLAFNSNLDEISIEKSDHPRLLIVLDGELDDDLANAIASYNEEDEEFDIGDYIQIMITHYNETGHIDVMSTIAIEQYYDPSPVLEEVMNDLGSDVFDRFFG